jgi:hypothetical protein
VLDGDAAPWRTAYSRRLRRSLRPDDGELKICGQCHSLKERFAEQRQQLDERWQLEYLQMERQQERDVLARGSMGIALDYTILIGGQSAGKVQAAQTLDQADLLTISQLDPMAGFRRGLDPDVPSLVPVMEK